MVKDLNLEDLKLFAIVMEQGSFTRAASIHGSSKSHVSKRMSGLESYLGHDLLHRTTRRLGLTAAGEALLPFAQELLKTERNAMQALDQLQEEVAGMVKFSMPVSLGEPLSQEIIWPFCQKYPQVEVEVVLSNSFHDLEFEGIDLAIRGGQVFDDRLVAQPLFKIQEVLCASPQYLEEHGLPADVPALAQHSCLVNTSYEDCHNWLFYEGKRVEQVSVRGNISSNHYYTTKKAVLASMGIARLPFYLIRDELKAKQLIALLPQYQSPPYPAFLVYPFQGILSKRVRVLIDYVKDWFDKNDINSS